MTADENSESESDTEEPPFEKITINTDYKIKTSLKEPHTNLELKPLPDYLEYVFLEEPSFLPKGGITVVTNENDELVPTRTVTSWRLCIDYRKLNEATAKDHFSLPFMDQMRMPFGLYNSPTTFQRCMLAIFHDMIEEFVEVFMDDFSVFGDSFDKCLNNLDKMLQHCKDAHLVLNWEKCRFMVKEGIMLGHKVSGAGLEVDKAKINVISKLSPPTNIKDIYAAGSENRPPMLNKENYVPWSLRLLRYAKSRTNGKLIYNSFINGPYVRRMIPEPGDQNRKVPVNETFHEQTDAELTEKELK
nr:reverse transcriptase domain-containing protein [Tanacetum cinerariifolium]